MILETLIAHGSDWIEWVDASGIGSAAPRRVSPDSLTVTVAAAPADLTLIHKTAVTALWRRQPEGVYKLVDGSAVEADLARPAEPVYAFAGVVADRAGRYLPRSFALQLGGGGGRRVSLYRSPLGTVRGGGGSLRGRLRFAGGKAAAWAVVALSVAPPLGPALSFAAQADVHGEFELSLLGLPVPTKDSPAKTYPAHLAVRATVLVDPNPAIDPDVLPAARVATGQDAHGNPVFAASIAFAITPAAVASIASPGQPALLLESN